MTTDVRKSYSVRLPASDIALLQEVATRRHMTQTALLEQLIRKLRRETAYAEEAARYATGDLGPAADDDLAGWQDLQTSAVTDLDL